MDDFEKKIQKAFEKIGIKPVELPKQVCFYCGGESPDFSSDGKAYHVDCLPDPLTHSILNDPIGFLFPKK